CLAMNVSPVMGQNLTGAIVAAQGTTSGSIVGCFLDSIQRPLPGATVAVKGDGVERSTVTDGAGCYEFKDLPLALYRVIARLAGFDNVTRDRLIVAPAQATRLDLTTRLSPICECVGVAGGLAEHWNHAAAVLHLRLADSEPVASTRQGYYRHFATVIPNAQAACRPSFRHDVCFSKPAEWDVWSLRRWARAGGVPGIVRLRLSDRERRARVGCPARKRRPGDGF